MRYLTLSGLLICVVTACSDGPSPVGPDRAVVPTQVSAQVTPEPIDELFVSEACGFTVLMHQTGKVKGIELPGGRTTVIFPASVVTLTNPANGKTERVSNTGTFHINPLPNGGVEFVLTGRNTVEDVELGIVLTIGNFILERDAITNRVVRLEGTGQVVDLCELMA
jgi:hypothetical protein